MKKVKIKQVKNNDSNPRYIKDHKFTKLVESIKQFPEMLEARPIVVNKEMVVLGGNMRLRACKKAGLKEVFIEQVDWSEEKQREFIIKDNASFGEWDWDLLANQWEQDLLINYGLDVPEVDPKGEPIDAEVQFSEYLDEQHNYVVLYFDNRIDWLQAETHFSLKSVSAKRSNGKAWSKGVGRVINGAKYLKKLTDHV